MGNHTQEHIKLCPYNLDYKQPMLRFGYYLLFWNAYLQEEATQNLQLVRENPPLYGQIIILLNLSGKRHISTDKVFKCGLYSACAVRSYSSRAADISSRPLAAISSPLA